MTELYKVTHFWPKQQPATIPSHLPPSVQRAFRQAEQNFNIPDNEEAAGMMFRRALDIALKEIGLNNSKPLAVRIKQASDRGILTEDLATWAKEITVLGNEATHEIDGIERPELEQLRGLTEMVLRYVFTLPGMVRELRGEVEEPEVSEELHSAGS